MLHFPGLVLDMQVEVAREAVAGALGNEVQLHAAGLGADVVGADGDLQFLVGVHVQVGGSGTDGGVVGDVGAVHVPGGVVLGAAAGQEVGLLARIGAADVHAVNHHARGQ